VIVVDTNVLFALADRRDAHHVQCRNWLAGCDEPLIVLPTVLAEACYLIDKYLGPTAEAAFLDSIGPGYRFQLAGLVDEDLRRMAELVRRYADRRLGGTDASVIAVCERLSVATVATVNRRDFANVRPRHVPAFAIVP
jgi:uncharacterized protein